MNGKTKCIKCGLCVMECRKQWNCITLTKDGPEIDFARCRYCGHCEAVCPMDAIDFPSISLQDFSHKFDDPDDVERYLRSVRSVRYYKNQLVPRGKMERLLDIGRYPQTGKNSQGISYLVLEGREKVDALHRLFCAELERCSGEDEDIRLCFEDITKREADGSDVVFRDCPELIIALADKDNERGRENAQFSLTFISLLAPSLGIGTCWAGYFEKIACRDEFSAGVREFLKVPEGKMIRGAMMVGIPEYKFRRMVERRPLEMDWR